MPARELTDVPRRLLASTLVYGGTGLLVLGRLLLGDPDRTRSNSAAKDAPSPSPNRARFAWRSALGTAVRFLLPVAPAVLFAIVAFKDADGIAFVLGGCFNSTEPDLTKCGEDAARLVVGTFYVGVAAAIAAVLAAVIVGLRRFLMRGWSWHCRMMGTVLSGVGCVAFIDYILSGGVEYNQASVAVIARAAVISTVVIPVLDGLIQDLRTANAISRPAPAP